jgi:hypothetical protein
VWFFIARKENFTAKSNKLKKMVSPESGLLVNWEYDIMREDFGISVGVGFKVCG